jgi:hypothetical protein
LGLLVLSPAVLIGVGLASPRIASTIWATVAEAGLRVVGASAVLYGLLWMAPRFKQIFADFGTELPAPTEWLITVSDAARSLGGLPLIAVVLALSAVEVIAFAAWHRDESTSPSAAALSHAVTALNVALILGFLAGCIPPLIKLIHDLS